MKIIEIKGAENRVVVEAFGKQRVVDFSENGDIDIEPFDDLADDEAIQLFDEITGSEEIAAALDVDSFNQELLYNNSMKVMTIKLNKMDAFNKLRKGPAGQGKFGSFAFRDKTKYSRKGRQPRDGA